MTTKTEAASGNEKESPATLRSPKYPFVGLKTAVERAEEFYKNEGRNAAPIKALAAHWDISPTSSAARQTAAALVHFGLSEQAGSSYKLTPRALRIILDKAQDSPGRVAALHEAAMYTPIHRKLWDRYGANLPSDHTLRVNLIFEEKFNENAVARFISQYKETLEFSGLRSGTLSGVDPIGDEEETPMDLATDPTAVTVPRPKPTPGEHEVLRSKVSSVLTMRVLANGEVTAQDIDKLVRLLTLQKELLEEEPN